MFTRRVVLALPLAACAAPLAHRPDLIRDFDPARQEALYPTDKSFLALYRRGGAVLGWVAAKHSADPDSQTAEVVRAAFARVRPRAVVLEGVGASHGKNPQRLKDYLAARDPAEATETEVAARLAFTAGVDVWGGEPSEAQLAAALVGQGFRSDDVVNTALFGPLEQEQRGGAFAHPGDPRFAQAFAAMAADIARGYGLGAPPTLDQFRAWHLRTFGAALRDDPRWFERGWPEGDSIPARIARASNRQRDISAYQITMARLAQDRVVLVIYGASHLSNVWDALAASLDPPRFVLS